MKAAVLPLLLAATISLPTKPPVKKSAPPPPPPPPSAYDLAKGAP